MKNDFITIPDAPNYEINSEGEVRNKTTGKFLKIVNNKASFKLHNGSKTTRNVQRMLNAFFGLPYKDKEWLAVPSLNYKYEVSESGLLRNAETKKILKKTAPTSYALTINQKRTFVTIANLLWEVHGIINDRSTQPVTVIVQHKNTREIFSSCSAAARYLAPKVFLSSETVRWHLTKRRAEIYDYKITYISPDDLSQVDSSYKTIGRKKNR